MKFYRTVLQIEILSASEEPPDIDGMALKDVAREVCEGDWSGTGKVSVQQEVTPQKMAQLAQAQCTDPEFFGLTPDGQLIDE